MQTCLGCYVSGRHLPGQEKHGLVSFAVPEWGILFRCLADGPRTDLEILALMSFLRFAEHNHEIFAGRQLRIFTDCQILLFLMKGGTDGPGSEKLRRRAAEIAPKIHFTVEWIDSDHNRAAASAATITSLPAGSRLQIKPFPGLTEKEPPRQSAGRNKV